MTPTTGADLLLLLVTLVFAGNFPLGKRAAAERGPITITASRALLATPLLLLAARILAGPMSAFARTDHVAFAVISLTGSWAIPRCGSGASATRTVRWYHLVGATAVIAGVLLATSRR